MFMFVESCVQCAMKFSDQVPESCFQIFSLKKTQLSRFFILFLQNPSIQCLKFDPS